MVKHFEDKGANTRSVGKEGNSYRNNVPGNIATT